MLTEMRGTAQQTVQHMGSRLSCAPVISNSLRRDADNLVHDTLERALAKSALWLGVLDMRAWLFGMMHNLLKL